MADPSEPQSPAPPPAARPAQLRSRLFVLAASGLLPLALMAGIALASLVEDRQAATQHSALTLSRALATAVDADLRATVAVLGTLSQNEDLQDGQFERFYRVARRVAVQQGWRAIVLSDAKGQVVVRTAAPFGHADRRPVEPESIAQALALQRPVVGVVTEGSAPGQAFGVRLPLRLRSNDQYVLSAVLNTDQVLNVLQRQSVPGAWVVAVFDRSGHRVARTRQALNQRPSPSLAALLREGRAEGVGVTTTLEGQRSLTGYTRLPDSGWVIAVAIPAAEAQEVALGPMLAVLLGLVASLALSAYLGWIFAGRVSKPIGVLKDAAAALGRGEPVQPTGLEIAELEEVGGALARASAQREQFMQELRQGQAEREALLRQVTDALRAAEDAGRIKDEFLAILGHELRNPLAPIAMAMQLMAIKGDPATTAERRIVDRQLAHMTRLVDDLLDLSRITGKRLAMKMAPLRVGELVQQAADAIGPVLGGRRLRVEIASAAADAWVSGDEARLAQVFGNLLGNAVKFTPADGELAIAARLTDGAVEIEVGDSGSGMSPDVLARAFEPFFQERQGDDRSRGGLGLGLAIVKSLVEMHGGSVLAESAGHNRGSRVRVRLPLASSPAPADPVPTVPAPGGAGRVLLVDDNRDAADTSAALLEISGYETRVAYDPRDALALLADYAPDVAVLDIGLPGMSGYELARHVRAHPNGAHCGLIALTGYGQADDVAMARQHGFDVHLAKPAAADVLLARIAELIERRRN
ncbi:hybrid sensor histidine kinase/response regulator [Ramlibacter sp.]|uniref:hybrid sensor histidine kinase/response regulator n=1 Tax=Ramlibacter sp. TaxID=1917967 RepID=UPI002C9946B8|nr:ATP-binding protein [Ramlibacter sp.]HWI80781.1 ATP-binding protein [Ramlibacter sp.]